MCACVFVHKSNHPTKTFKSDGRMPIWLFCTHISQLLNLDTTNMLSFDIKYFFKRESDAIRTRLTYNLNIFQYYC